MKEASKKEPFPKIAIILLNWNGKKDTIECLTSLEKLTYPNFEVIIIDNGSTDDSVIKIREKFPKHQIIETHQNLGFAGGNNVGIHAGLAKKADFLFLLNNDTIIDPNLLNAFLEHFNEKANAGILGAKILRYDQPLEIDHLGGRWESKIAEFVSLKKGEKDNTFPDQMEKVDYVCGCALFMKKEVIKKIGYLEPKFFLLWEESDFCFRAKKAGFEIWTAPKAKVWHKISSSFVGGKPHMQYFWWRSRLLWIGRNCSKKEKTALYFKIIAPEIFHFYKLRTLKLMQLTLLKFFNPKAINEKRLLKLRKYQAGCEGIKDYFLHRFGKGPSWLHDPIQISQKKNLPKRTKML